MLVQSPRSYAIILLFGRFSVCCNCAIPNRPCSGSEALVFVPCQDVV